MTTSGTYSFNLDLPELIDAAYELSGLEGARAGNDLRKARRHIDLILREWQNDGVNLWTLELTTQALTQGTAQYSLTASTQDIFDAYIRRGSTDFECERISLVDYNDRSLKSQQGMPNNFVVVRGITQPTLYLWPTPENSTDVFYYWRIRDLQDSSTYTNTPDVPKRFLTALTWGLAWQLAVGRPNPSQTEIGRISMLGQKYDAAYKNAREGDRENADWRILPDLSHYG